ncbi:hypothetical protein GPECTOR_23g156 [Gonium pectorale]|uniref:Multiple C2 domain-containing protein n=1 Tax=Gonium pectorale TaxID=33097 RepID=A0A150GGV1_GONPE|nr:hypothetical protein GPECTOR_23g156 [Gonium pectorale]|eukprot:KXZ49071.1 hypothetical protein GPECTOR_23g156 [Gonium pectorale]
MERSVSPPQHTLSSGLSGAPDAGDADAGVSGTFTGAWRRARGSRPVSLVTGALGATAGAVGGALPALWGVVRAGGGLVMRRRETGSGAEREAEDALQQRRSLVGRGLRGVSGGGAMGGSPQAGRARAVPVSTTLVQDGVKWVNLVRFVNLARLFTPCFRPLRGPRRRVRFAGAPSQRGILRGSAGGADGCKAACDMGASGGGATPCTAGTIRPIYIQALPVPLPGTGGGAAAGGGGGGGASGVTGGNTVVWNEVFSFPRSCLEGRAAGRVVLQVWSSEPYGDDTLVGQAELDLGPMLAAERPHPLAAMLELQAIDEDTGTVEPGSCGELAVAAWVEPGPDAPRSTTACPLTSSLPPSDLDEAGVVTSTLSAPCGSKSMPAVVHSPLGTLYEEPCVVVLKITVTGLADLNWELMKTTAQQGGITKRRVRLEGALRSVASGAVRGGGGGAGAGGGASGGGGTPPAATAASGSPTAPRAQPALGPSAPPARGLSRLLSGSLLQRSPTPARGGVAAASGPLRSPRGGGGSPQADAKGAAGFLSGLRHSIRFGRGGSAGGAAAAGGTAGDDLIEEEEDPIGGGGGGAGGGAGGGGGGGGVYGRGLSSVGTSAFGDEEDGSSLALHATAPLSGITSGDEGGGGAAGAGISVDKQSDKSRLRFMPAGPQASTQQQQPGGGGSPQQAAAPQSQPPPLPPGGVSLQPATFVFALARPLPNAPVVLTMYVTSSARRRGRAVGRVSAHLYDLLDQVLGAAAAAGGGPGVAGPRRDGGVSGKPVDVKLEFEDQELGSVQATVQLADMDERAMLFRVPLVADPAKLMADGQYGQYGMYDGGGGWAGPGASVVPAEGYLPGYGPSGGGGGGGGGGGVTSARALGPVLGDTALLRRVLQKSGVDGDVEDWFVRSYARAGSLKVAGGGGLQVGGRVKSGMRLVSSLAAWLRHICSWRSRRDSWEVVAAMALLCYRPGMACKLFFILIALTGIRRWLDVPLKSPLASAASGDATSALLAPASASAATTTAAAAAVAAAAAAAAGGGPREPVGTIGDVTIGGGVVDDGSDDEAGEDSKVPVGTVAEVKRKLAELVELGLMLQNLFDDVASLLERLQAVLSFSDVVASWLFIGGCLAAAGVMALLGFKTSLFLTLLWQVRPPVLRDALPPPPLNYFLRLPCKSAAEFG